MTKRKMLMCALLAEVVALSACSVSTPRDQLAVGGSLQSGTGAQDGVSVTGPGSGGSAGGVAGTRGGSGAAGTAGGSSSSRRSGTGVVGPAGVGGGPAGSGGGGGPAGSGGGAAAGGGAAGPSGSTVGVTKNEITFSFLAGYSGTYGEILSRVVDSGAGTWIADINARGGINGRKIRMIKVDNRDTAEGGVAACKAVQANNSYFAFSLAGFGGADTTSLDCLDKAGIPTIGSTVSSFNPNWKFVHTITDSDEATRPLASFIKNVMKKGSVPIGVMNERDPFYRAGKPPFMAAAKAAGLNIVASEDVDSNQSNFVAPLSRLKSAGAEVLVLIVGAPNTLGILRDAKALNYTPAYVGNYWAVDEFATAAGDLYNGITTLRYFGSVNSPQYAKYRALANKYGTNSNTSSSAFSVYGMGEMLEQALRNIGPEPTIPGFATGLEKVVNFEDGAVAYSFGPGKKRAQTGQYPVKCCNSDRTWMGIGPPRREF